MSLQGMPKEAQQQIRNILYTLRNTPAFQILRQKQYAEAYEEAQQILAYGYVELSFKDKYVYEVAPQMFKVKLGKTKVWCNCDIYKQWGFCSHILAVQLKREKSS